MNSNLDEREIRKTLSVLKHFGDTFEVRLLPAIGGKSKKISSGYFQSADELFEALKKFDTTHCNCYLSLQRVNPDAYSREQAGHFVANAESTKKEDIQSYEWLFIDLDPERTKGISSTNEELEIAHKMAKNIYKYLQSLGWEEPVTALSGNGYHLLYGVNLQNNEENAQLIKDVLQTLDWMFSSVFCKVDIANADPSRICKLYGSLAQKGTSSAQRPHRMAKLLYVPEQVKPTAKAYLEKLVADSPIKAEAPEPAKWNNYSPSEFDVCNWMNAHGVGYKEQSYKDGTKYVLDECPFCGHKAPDSAVFKTFRGALGFKCLHNSCQTKNWKDFRIYFEPDAYEKKQAESDKRIEEGWKRHNAEMQKKALQEQKATNSENAFETLFDILALPNKERVFIQTGIAGIDTQLHGLEKGKLSILTGLRGSGKSTLLSQITLKALDNQQRVISYSGELTNRNLADWLFLQAAGKANIVASSAWENYFTTPDDIKREIASAIGDKLFIYKNDLGHNWDRISQAIRKKAEEIQSDLIIIDNLMTIDIIGGQGYYDKLEAQTGFVRSLKNLAADINAHVLLVAHPRKAMGLLRLDDISGTGNLTNYVDTAFIMHRKNQDFLTRAQATLLWKSQDHRLIDTHDNLIEIAKDRETGVQDYWIPLWYEPQTKRFKNGAGIDFSFSWERPPIEKKEEQTLNGFIPISDEELPF